MLFPKEFTLCRKFFSSESTAENTEIKHRIAMEIPNNDKNARNLLLNNSLMDKRILSMEILSQII